MSYVIRCVDDGLYLESIDFVLSEFESIVPEFYFYYDINHAKKYTTEQMAKQLAEQIGRSLCWSHCTFEIVKVD